MKRWLLPALGFVLVLAACGAGSGPAPQVSERGAHIPPQTVKAIAAARERVALRKAGSILRGIAIPPGAIRVARPPAGNEDLSHSWLGTSVITMTAERASFWRTRGSMASVMRFAKRHPVARMTADGSGRTPGEWETIQFYGRFHHPLQRTASITAVRAGGWTYVRVDAGAAWIYPRSPREAVPAGVREIDIRDKTVHVRVTGAAKVARIVRWFGELNVAPPGVHVECMAILASPVTFVFRSANGEKLASAVVPSEPADGCDAIQFRIGGEQQTPLIDTTAPKFAFVKRVQRLLGVCFEDPYRKCRKPS